MVKLYLPLNARNVSVMMAMLNATIGEYLTFNITVMMMMMTMTMIMTTMTMMMMTLKKHNDDDDDDDDTRFIVQIQHNSLIGVLKDRLNS